MKVRPKVDLQRREIALSAGVTPALVSYYYRDKWDLFAAAAKPVLETYVEKIHKVLQPPDPPRQKLLALIRTFLEFNYYEGYILDFCIQNSVKMELDDSLHLLREVNDQVTTFFDELLRDGHLRGADPSFVHASLWGLCKHMAQKADDTDSASPSNSNRMLQRLSTDVFDLFLNGIAVKGFHIAHEPQPHAHHKADDPRLS